ncbi:MAG TPA: DnaA regulatory inactivator Hda [Gammaproteobacteria bacterium]|jgi:DnaA family protein|nr:DnaA regulatory inactivator Hda [Gammaproteobacteria bacterium]
MSAERVLEGQLPLPITLDEGATFDSFHAGPNAAAVDALQTLAKQGGTSVMFLHGADGTGKSHLLQAACRAATAVERRAMYLPMSQAVLLDPSAVENFDRYALVCLDDVQRVAGTEPWQRALLTLIDSLKQNGGGFVASARGAPGSIKRLLPDLVSRLSWGPVFQLEVMGDTDKIAAMQQRAHRRGFELPDDTAKFLLNRLQRDMSTLCATLDTLDTASLVAQRKLTVPFVKSVIEKR